MYVSPALRGKLDPGVIGWRSDRGWRDPEHLSHGAPDFNPAAEKYEGGMLNFPGIYAMGASLELILEIGPDAIERRVLEIAALTRTVLCDAGAHVPNDCLTPIVCARFEGADASSLARELRTRNVATAARQGNLRVSPHLYNDETDLEHLAAVLWESGFRARTSLQTPQGSSHPAG
jgi:selenocysteine lyase/cysteine desulfurase